MKRKRNSYDITFKLKVVEFAKSHSNRAAEREYGIDEKMVRDWRAKESKMLLADTPSVKKMRVVLSPYVDIEKKIADWVHDLRSSSLVVTRSTIRRRALQLAKEADHKEFKASPGWCSRFMERFNLTLCQRTHKAQKLQKESSEVNDDGVIYNDGNLIGEELEKVFCLSDDKDFDGFKKK